MRGSSPAIRLEQSSMAGARPMRAYKSHGKTQAVPPDVAAVQAQPETLERLLIVGAIKSIRFFRQLRSKICPWDPEARAYRKDFNNPHYNTMWPLIAAKWGIFDQLEPAADVSMPLPHLENFMVDWARKGLLMGDEAVKIKELLWPEIENLEFTEELYQGLLTCEAFQAWLSARVVSQEVALLSKKFQLRPATLCELQAAVDRAKSALAPMTSNLVNARDVLYGQRTLKRPVSTGIEALDQVLGGGLVAPGTAMIAAATGGGKTTLAAQFLVEFARRKQRTVHVTTEEPPDMLILRMVSNICSIDLKDLVVPKNTQFDETDTAVLNIIPDWVRKDRGHYEKLVQLGEMLQNYIYIIDWSKGQNFSIIKHLDAEMEKITATGWEPNILQVDWIGGAVTAVNNYSGDDRNKIHEQYQAATDYVVNHCKRFNRAGIVFAQCDTKLVKPTTKRVTKEMLSRSKTMANNCSVFIGLSSLRSEVNNGRLDPVQYLTSNKVRYGEAGAVEVRANLKYQRFESPSHNIGSGGGGQVR